jgi:hypothetical protein
MPKENIPVNEDASASMPTYSAVIGVIVKVSAGVVNAVELKKIV